MTLTNITPSTGEARPVSMNLNALKIRPGDHVVYWSAGVGIRDGIVSDWHHGDQNTFVIDGEPVFVTLIYARLRDDMTPGQLAAVITDFASLRRKIITGYERMQIRDRHGLSQ